jgi:integrase
LLALVWRVLEKSARLSLNPWKAIGRKRFAVKSRRELTVEELGNVFNKAQGEMRLLLALGTFCGLRLGDAATLEWSNVDLVKGIISLIPRKTARRAQKRVTLPIHRTLFAMLLEIPKALRRGFVMPTLCERYNSFDGALAKDVAALFLSVNIKTNANAQTASEKEAEEKAKTKGAELPKSKATGKRASADCGFHSLRHTFVSLCAAGGVSQSVVQSLVGHGSPAMTQHYTHIAIETAQSAVALIPDVTHTNTEEGTKDATHAKLAVALSMLDGFDTDQLQELVKKAKAAIKAKKA